VVGLGGVVVAYAPSLLSASVQPMIDRDFRFSVGELGLVVAVFYATSAVASRPAGHLVDRFGPALGVRTACVIQVCTALGVALIAHSYVAVLAFAGVSGLANALIGPSSAALIVSGASTRLRPFGLGLVQSGGSVAALLTGLAVAVLAVPLGWRWLFALAAAAAAALALATPARSASDGDASPRRPSAPVRGLGPARLLGVAAALAAMATVGMSSFIVPYAVQVGIDQGHAGLILATVGFTGALCRPLSGVLLGRRDVAATLLGAALLVGAASIGFGILTFAVFPALLLGAVLVGGIGGSWTSLGAIAGTALAPGRPGAAVAVLMTGLFAGAVAGPALVGAVSTRAGFTAVWLAAGIATLLAALTLLRLRALTQARV
jgi:MFS family permease